MQAVVVGLHRRDDDYHCRCCCYCCWPRLRPRHEYELSSPNQRTGESATPAVLHHHSPAAAVLAVVPEAVAAAAEEEEELHGVAAVVADVVERRVHV